MSGRQNPQMSVSKQNRKTRMITPAKPSKPRRASRPTACSPLRWRHRRITGDSRNELPPRTVSKISQHHLHLRHLHPFPRNLGALLARFPRVLVPELNTGQLVALLRARYLVPAEGLNKVAGRPFRVQEIADAVRARLEAP